MIADTRFTASGIGLFPGVPGPFLAGFSTRRLLADDVPIDEAVRVFAAELTGEAGLAETARVRQVHGRGVIVVDEPPRAGLGRVLGEADALMTRSAGRLLVIATADCVPIVLIDPGSGWIAAVHAGWRGTAARILDRVLSELTALGADTGRLRAFFGPSISRDRYEVGPEVVGMLTEAYRDVPVSKDAIAPGAGDRSLLDVAAFNEALLAARGIDREHIVRTTLCTASEPDLFPSFRRDGARAGRILTGVYAGLDEPGPADR
jgi:YfiH family protein